MAPRGRPRTAQVLFVEECVELNVFEIDLPADPHSMPSSATVTSTWQDGKTVDQTVSLTYTRPHYGGVRMWLLCPECDDRRCGKLFAHDGHRKYSCRECLHLVYESQYRKQRLGPVEQLVKWQRSSDASKRRWGRKMEQALVEGQLSWKEAWQEING